MPHPRSTMRRWRRVFAGTVLALGAVAADAAAAVESGKTTTDEVAALKRELEALRSEYAARLAALEAQIERLETRVEEPAPAPPPPSSGGGRQSATYFNPAISLVGNVLAVAGNNPIEDLPNASLSESELSLRSVIDPYARADVYLAFSEEGVEVEEGFVTFTALPAKLLARVGRMRAGFGKVNTLHLHALPWPDTPLPMENLVGGEEGWKGDGVSVSRLLPIGDTFTELTVEAFHPAAEELFESVRRSEVATNAHYRIFGDLSESANLDFGLSWARGPNGAGRDRETTLYGVDVTWRWKPLRTALYRGLELRGELVASDREMEDGTAESAGWFLSGDYRLARRWWIGGRLESSERADDDSLRDRGHELLLTFAPSEYSRLRAAWRRREYAEGPTADELLLQLQFVMGAHGAHPF